MAAGVFQFAKALDLFRTQTATPDQVRHAGDGVERRADLMTHIGQKSALGEVRRLRRLLGRGQFGRPCLHFGGQFGMVVAQDTLGFAPCRNVERKTEDALLATEFGQSGGNADLTPLAGLVQPGGFPVEQPPRALQCRHPALACLVVRPQRKLDRGLADKVGRRPAEIALVVAIDLDESAISGAGDRGGDRAGMKRRFKALPRLTQGILGRRLGPPVIGDIIAGGQSADRQTLTIDHPRCTPGHQAELP